MGLHGQLQNRKEKDAGKTCGVTRVIELLLVDLAVGDVPRGCGSLVVGKK